MNMADMLTLVEYNKWANNRLMRRAAHLSQEQLNEPCWLSQGNLYDTLIHTVDAQYSWRLACHEGKLPAERLSQEQFANVAAFRIFWQEEDAALITFVTSLGDAALNEIVEFYWGQARPRTRTLWYILFHVVNHGTIHRSEIGQYMDTLDRSPGNMDFIMFTSRKRT
jgi:uncharacterized damage-inducible protein DinB